jgi:hypothetical protein
MPMEGCLFAARARNLCSGFCSGLSRLLKKRFSGILGGQCNKNTRNIILQWFYCRWFPLAAPRHIWLLSGAVCCFDEAVLVYGGVASGIELKVNRIAFLVDRAYLKLKNARMIMHLESLRG